jgi:hypothetical protein
MKISSFCLPFGKADATQLLRCQGLAVDDYSFALGRLEAGATSTFAQLGYNVSVLAYVCMNRSGFQASDQILGQVELAKSRRRGRPVV